MPILIPEISNTIGFDDSLVVDSKAMDFNQFNQGVISEKYTVIRFSVFSDNKLQLEEQIIVDYVEANGNRKTFSQSPRIDKFQISDVLNCVDIPKITCDGLNRFTYRILPATEVYVIFEVDKTNSVSQVFKKSTGSTIDQNNAVIESMFDGYDSDSLKEQILPDVEESCDEENDEDDENKDKFTQYELGADGIENIIKGSLSKNTNNIKTSNKAIVHENSNNIWKIAAITIPFLLLVWGLSKIKK
jgi:hypothetical protein